MRLISYPDPTPDDPSHRTSFWYEPLPHEDGCGFSYNINMGTASEPDIVHLDTKHGTNFNHEELIALHAYLLLVRRRR